MAAAFFASLGTSRTSFRLLSAKEHEARLAGEINTAGRRRIMQSDPVAEWEKVAEQQKQAGADQIDEMSKAVHSAADRLERQMPETAGFVHAAATRLERGAGALRERNMSDLMAGFNELARKDPLTLLGGAMLAGFAISRFLKSSADSSP
jgi:hypothetical protein